MYAFFAKDMVAFVISITAHVAAETLQKKKLSLGN
jgi:hypothetical protein